MDSFEGAAPIPTETVAMELDTVTIIEAVMNQLEGKIYDPTVNGYVERGRKMVNDMGAKQIATFLSSYISRDKILSNFTEDKIREISREAAGALSIVLLMNYKNYGIEKANLQVVQNIVEHAIESNLYRARDGRTLDHISNIVKINMKQEGRGFGFPGLGGMFGGKPKVEKVQEEAE